MEVVNIRIKSPSSVLPDLQMSCEINKTVLQLKAMIEVEYESHPTPGEQKLVYSGKLLQDEQLLREFLRFEDECSLFTIHLVCKLSVTSQLPQSSQSMLRSLPSIPNTQDGVRYRGNLVNQAAPEPETPPELLELESIRSMLDSLAGSQLGQTEAADIQELYNQYLTLYTQYARSTQSLEQEVQQEAANPIPPQFPEVPGEEVEPGNNDLLDYAYAIIRVLILLCVVYAHSNFFRLLFVVVGMGLIYYAQGRNRRNQELNNNQENVVNPGGNEAPYELNPDQVPEEEETEETEPKPNVLMVAFTFISSFITSIY